LFPDKELIFYITCNISSLFLYMHIVEGVKISINVYLFSKYFVLIDITFTNVYNTCLQNLSIVSGVNFLFINIQIIPRF